MLESVEKRKAIKPFFIKYQEEFIHGNLIYGSSGVRVPEVLFIHGCNPVENSSDFLVLRQLLLEKHGINSCAFDFPGHGNTSGNWGKSTIEQRTEQSIDVINACFDSQPLNIVASGLSAYISIRLTQLCTVKNLILLAPELCAYEAYNMEPGKNHNEFDKLSQAWSMTDALSIIQFFNGGLSILSASNGSSVQREVAGQLYVNALRARDRKAIDVFGKFGSYPMEYASQNPTVIRCILEIISGFCGNVTTSSPDVYMRTID